MSVLNQFIKWTGCCFGLFVAGLIVILVFLTIFITMFGQPHEWSMEREDV